MKLCESAGRENASESGGTQCAPSDSQQQVVGRRINDKNMNSKIWQHMAETHGLHLTESEEHDIVNAANETADDTRIYLLNKLSAAERDVEDARSLLRFQDLHKSAEMLHDKARLEWLLNNSFVVVGGKYLTMRESLDAAIAAKSANPKLSGEVRSND